MDNVLMENLKYIEVEQAPKLLNELYEKLNGYWCPKCQRWYIPLSIYILGIHGTTFGVEVIAQVICSNCGHADKIVGIY